MSHSSHSLSLIKYSVVALTLFTWGCSTTSHTQQNETSQNDTSIVASEVEALIEINGEDSGRQFDGIGGLSAGASSRLLYDYPDEERSQILDYLFKPGYGAGLQILKVEIGGDMNSTDGSEASHMRTPGEVNCNRGYEWWLMKEAKERNPDIKLAGLAWGVPGWMGEFWSQENIEYHLEWLNCAENEHGLTIDYMGGWNERPHDEKRFDWFVDWKAALEEHYPHIDLIGDDRCCTGEDREALWEVADNMVEMPDFNDAIDVLGIHWACGWRNDYDYCVVTDNALSRDKPLWISENSALYHDVGGKPHARALNRMYIDAQITGYITWAAISAWYSTLPLADTGLMLAEWPWSGYYQIGKSPWSFAHTTQFTRPGWKYIDKASGYLSSGASYVSLQSPDGQDYTTVIEAVDATGSQTVEFEVSNLPADKTVHLWASDFNSDRQEDFFTELEEISPEEGRYGFTLQPGYVYSLSTVEGGKGSAAPATDVYEQMELPYSEDFEEYGEGELARFFSDVNGAFETVNCSGDRDGICYRQDVTQQPHNWSATGTMPPTTIFGDPNWWGDYKVSTDVMLEDTGYVELISRISALSGLRVAGYHFQLKDNGEWKFYRQELNTTEKDNEEQILASGESSFRPGEWHTITLDMNGKNIVILLDGETLEAIEDEYFITGQIGLRANGWQNAQFDDVEITPNGRAPETASQGDFSITATSDQPGNHGGRDYVASRAIDGRIETFWHTEFDENKATLPQSVILDLGESYKVEGLIYQPRMDNHQGGMITRYNIYVSKDGATYKKVAQGNWQKGNATKIADWDSMNARYIKLEAVEAVGGSASAGELNVIITD
ncbi:MAG: discoidin domain-containing protein [Balneolaceae bacterium]